ncbi:MAG: polysaccharide deacetylase family protein [Clostridia bacterium]|nr:polysaccharide deacetylase family protein [Clostridia bacterium]
MKRLIIQKSITAITVLMLICMQINVSKNIAVSTSSDLVKLPILMYHGFTENGAGSDYVIKTEEFEEDIIYLINNGYEFVNTKDLIDYCRKGILLPEKCVMITFDDGYLNNYTYAYPIIMKYGVKVVLSPIGYWSDYQTVHPDSNPAYANLTWEQIKEMSDSGLVEIQNHSYNMHSLSDGRMGSDRAEGESPDEYRRLFFEDMKNAHYAIENATGTEPVAYAYPFGSIGDESKSLLKCFGYMVTFSCCEGYNYISGDDDCLYGLKRFNRSADRSAQSILGSADN